MSDGRARKVFRTQEQWLEIIARHEASGLPAGEFCKGEGINSSVYYRWHRQLTGSTRPARQAQRAKPATPFIDLGEVRKSDSGGVELRLELGGGIQFTLVRR